MDQDGWQVKARVPADCGFKVQVNVTHIFIYAYIILQPHEELVLILSTTYSGN